MRRAGEKRCFSPVRYSVAELWKHLKMRPMGGGCPWLKQGTARTGGQGRAAAAGTLKVGLGSCLAQDRNTTSEAIEGDIMLGRVPRARKDL